MRLEKIENRPLMDDERQMKEVFQNGNEALWEKPMTFSELEKHLELGRIVSTPTTHFYKDKSKEGLGITINAVQKISHAQVIVHPRYSYPVLHNHDYVEIIYIAAGSCIHFFQDSSFPMNKGDVCILAPNAFHALSCTNDESCIVNIMVNRQFFDQSFMEILRGGRVLSEFMEQILYQRSVSPYLLFHTGNDPWLLELAVHLISEAKGSYYASDYSIRLLTSEFLLHIVREYEALAIVPGKQKNTQNNLIVAVLGFLSVNYNRTSLSETARFFGYSPSYFSRFIRENTGKTYMQLITTIQMERAVTFMKNGQTNLAEVAQAVGCFDSSHFNKKFKSVYGMSPRQYEEQLSAKTAR